MAALLLLALVALADHFGLVSGGSIGLPEPKLATEFWSAQVVGVTDGDTIKALAQDGPQAGQEVKIRLFGIDAPEKKQSFGQRSRDHLAGLAPGSGYGSPD